MCGSQSSVGTLVRFTWAGSCESNNIPIRILNVVHVCTYILCNQDKKLRNHFIDNDKCVNCVRSVVKDELGSLVQGSCQQEYHLQSLSLSHSTFLSLSLSPSPSLFPPLSPSLSASPSLSLGAYKSLCVCVGGWVRIGVWVGECVGVWVCMGSKDNIHFVYEWPQWRHIPS